MLDFIQALTLKPLDLFPLKENPNVGTITHPVIFLVVV